MSKTWMIMVIIAVVGAGAWWLHGMREEEALQEESEARQAQASTEMPMPPNTVHPTDPPSAPPPSGVAPSDGLPEDETRLLRMYEELTAAFAAHPADCDAMATSLLELADRYGRDVEAWAKRQRELEVAERNEAAEQLARVAGPRMDSARTSIQKAMSICAKSDRFQEGLRKLAVLNAPS